MKKIIIIKFIRNMNTLPVDIISIIASHCRIVDILSFLLSSKCMVSLINKNLSRNLSYIYNLPKTSNFQQLIRYSKFGEEKLLKLSMLTDDVKIFKAYYCQNKYKNIDKNISKYGDVNICQYLFEINENSILISILVNAVKYDQCILVKDLLDKKIKATDKIYSYVQSIKMIKLLKSYISLNLNEIEYVKNAIQNNKWEIVIYFLEMGLPYYKYNGKTELDYLLYTNDNISSYTNVDEEILIKIVNLLIKNNDLYIGNHQITNVTNCKYFNIVNILLSHSGCQLDHFDHYSYTKNVPLSVIKTLLDYKHVTFIGLLEVAVWNKDTRIMEYLISIKDSIPKNQRIITRNIFIHRRYSNLVDKEICESLIKLGAPYDSRVVERYPDLFTNFEINNKNFESGIFPSTDKFKEIIEQGLVINDKIITNAIKQDRDDILDLINKSHYTTTDMLKNILKNNN